MNRTFIRIVASAMFLLMAQGVVAATAVEEAQALVNEGKLDAALKRLDSQLKTAPQDAEARFMRGIVLSKLNRVLDAIKTFADITRDYPQLPEPYNNLAVLYAQQGDYEKARDALEAALATHPSYATAHENLGDIYAALAGAAYNRALMLDQGNQVVRGKLSFLSQISKPGSVPGQIAAASAAPVTSSIPPTPPSTSPSPVEPPAVVVPPVLAAPPQEADAATIQAVRDRLTVWSSAWSSKDVDTYIGTYSDNFGPEGGVSRQTWEAQRRDRVARPRRISVGVVNPQFLALGDGRVRVIFQQEYESDSFSDQVTKVLEFRDEDGWKIIREYTR
ncbi:MAG: tetratricopeptide repeat protein [Panacagrimonas sp.]